MKINIKTIKYFILIFLVCACSTIKNKSNLVKDYSINKFEFTEFYKILKLSIPKKEVFTLEEKKLFDIKIINYGTKKIFVPKRLDMSSGENSELFIELYKKNKKDNYESYVQENKIVITQNHTALFKREVLSSKNGRPICISDIEIDYLLKIVDIGIYKAKVYLDLSNFGYFKVLQSDFFFEVIE